MPSFTNFYVEPGVYIKVQNVPAPNVTGNLFIPVFIGLGRKEYDIVANLVRGVTSQDLLTDEFQAVDILSITDGNANYIKGVDFVLAQAGGSYFVDWNVPVTLTSNAITPDSFPIGNKTLKLTIDGITPTDGNPLGGFVIPAGGPYTANDIAGFINAQFAPAVPASAVLGQVVLTATNYIYVETGAQATEDMGWVGGQQVISAEPPANQGYIVTYKRMKLSTEYIPKMFSRLSDVYAEYGPYALPNEVANGTVDTNNTANLLNDGLADFVNTAKLGYYVKITDGTGKGQVRVITQINSASQLEVSPAWSSPVDTTSVYSILDGPFSEISIAMTIAQAHGSIFWIGSQSEDDIVDDNNFRLAIYNTKELVSGFQGWDLVYLKGVDVNESIVSYIKAYVDQMNGVTTKQERKALFGVKASLPSYLDVVALTTGIKNSRIGVVANPFARINSLGQLDGSYIASAIAGVECNPNYDAGEPISGKVLLFDYIDDPFLRSEKRLMGGSGAIVIEKQGVDYKIIHYLSTKVDDVIDSELKVIKQIDDLKKTLRSTMEGTLINIRITNGGKNIKALANSFINLILSEKVNAGTIAGYRNITVDFDPNDPRQLNIGFEFRPTFDLNWIFITFGASIQA